MPASGNTSPRRTGLYAVAAMLLLSSVGWAQQVDKATLELATGIFSTLEVKVVRCPLYTFDGENQPVCGQTELSPAAYTAAFDEAAAGKLEPVNAWDEDHTVWLRRYTARGIAYAAVYSEIARGFNVQLIRLK